MSVQQHGYGPIGATCGMCIHGPGVGQGVCVWFCRLTWSIVKAEERACAAYVPKVAA